MDLRTKLAQVRDERFGYELAAEADVIGITSWFMTREPTPPTGK